MKLIKRLRMDSDDELARQQKIIKQLKMNQRLVRLKMAQQQTKHKQKVISSLIFICFIIFFLNFVWINS